MIYETPHTNCVHSFMIFNDAFSLSVYAALNSEAITKLWSGEDLETRHLSECRIDPCISLRQQRNTEPTVRATHLWEEMSHVKSLLSITQQRTLCYTCQSTRRIATYMVVEKECPDTWDRSQGCVTCAAARRISVQIQLGGGHSDTRHICYYLASEYVPFHLKII